jgi:hypothetical protein
MACYYTNHSSPLAGLKISGLDTFGQRVLFAKVVPESDDLFWQFVGTVLVEIL